MNNLNSLLAGVSAAAVALVSASPALADGELNLLTWEGYADDSFIKPFEEATGCKVSATYVGSNDDFAPKLAAGGGVFDLISPYLTVDRFHRTIDRSWLCRSH